LEECGASPEVVGQHEQKLIHLELGQVILGENLQEVKSDLKELIGLLRQHLEQSQMKLEQRQDKIDDKIESFKKEANDNIAALKKTLFDLGIKIIIGLMGIGLLAAGWYIGKISQHILGG